MGKAHNSFMATRKAPSTKMTPNISTEPDTQDGGGQNCPMPTVETVEAFVAEVQDAPAAPGGTGTGGAPAAAPGGTGTGGGAAPKASPLVSSIPITAGPPGFYTGPRPTETLAQYNARLGAVADTIGDLGWVLGTKPKT